MKKKIATTAVKKGMYVSELDRPWVDTPFLFQGFEITTDEELAQLRKYCEHVYIDTTLGADVEPAAPGQQYAQEATAGEKASAQPYEAAVRTQAEDARSRAALHPDQTTLEEELEPAKSVERHTRDAVYNIMQDVRLGKSIDTASAKQAVAGMVDSIIRNPDALICLGQLKSKDEYTALHSLRVCILALAFGRHLDFTREELNILGLGALLHDIGKMKVPTEILNKPGRLTAGEFETMKSHVPQGVAILESTRGIPDLAIDVARYHHERFNGAGYAGGLKGEQISRFGLIGAIVDCYDAITSDRAYHSGLSSHEALKKMYEWRITDFDAMLVEQFIQCMGIYPIGSLVEMNTGSIGVVVTINRMRRLKPRVVLVLTPEKLPYLKPKIVNLSERAGNGSHRALEIRKVIAAGTYGVNPVDYLPVSGRVSA